MIVVCAVTARFCKVIAPCSHTLKMLIANCNHKYVLSFSNFVAKPAAVLRRDVTVASLAMLRIVVYSTLQLMIIAKMALVLTVHRVGQSRWGFSICVLLSNFSPKSQALFWYCAIRVGEERIKTAKSCTKSHLPRIILLAFTQSFKAKSRLC